MNIMEKFWSKAKKKSLNHIIVLSYFRNLDFSAGEPSGGLLQNDVVIDTNRKAFYDVEGDLKRCLACTSRKDAIYTLRGKCEDSLLGIC